MSDLICVRPMTAMDLDRILGIATELKQTPQWSRSAYIDALDPNAAVRRVSFAAEDVETGRLAGFGISNLTPPEGELETIGVASAYQRRGVARRLFDAMLRALRMAEVTTMYVEVRASNEPALALYRSIGFVVAGGRPRYYCDPVEDAVIMRLMIKANLSPDSQEFK